MVKIEISRHLIEQILTNGYCTDGIVTLFKDGLPTGAQLVMVKFDGETVELHFTDPISGPDRHLKPDYKCERDRGNH